MHTASSLVEDLKKMGLRATNSILIHSSMKSIGHVEQGAETVLDVWMDFFKHGILMLPTHTWATLDQEHNVYDPDLEPACVGILPNLMLKRKNVYRSLHPTHSICAYGTYAKNYVSGEENLMTPSPKEGVYGRLIDIDASIMLVGCGLERNTFIHALEEMMDIKERFTSKPILFKIKKEDRLIKRVFYKHYNKNYPHLSENFVRIENYLKEKGVITYHKFGDADVMLMKAKTLATHVLYLLEKDPHLFDTDQQFNPSSEA